MGPATGMHKNYQSMTVVDYSGSSNPQPYNAPTIQVPVSASSYTGWSAWSNPPTCNTAFVTEAVDDPLYDLEFGEDLLKFLQ